MKEKKNLTPITILEFIFVLLLKVIVFVLEASNKKSNVDSEHISYDDGISDKAYFNDIGNEFERDLGGSLRNKITERRYDD